ncbi:hypothetical protein BGZ88_003981, partial [Linnemannia elongata]
CKVGLSIRIQVDNGWKTEIAVFEFKTSTSTRQMCEKQQKKSMRLHVAILSGLEARGLDLQRSYPIVAEGRGQVLDFYTLRRHEDGRSTAKDLILRYLKLGLYILFLKCKETLSISVRDDLKGKNLPLEAPLVRLVHDL